MTEEQLDKACSLKKSISHLEHKLEEWKYMKGIVHIRFICEPPYRNSDFIDDNEVMDYMDTYNLQQKIVSNMEKRLAELKKEFKEL